jgi:hypothetical protein
VVSDLDANYQHDSSHVRSDVDTYPGAGLLSKSAVVRELSAWTAFSGMVQDLHKGI